jgi:hypothetical protein
MIEPEDRNRALEAAMRSCSANVATPVKMRWSIDGVRVESPVGLTGSVLTVDIELLLTGP